jgi:hypothetical protein
LREENAGVFGNRVLTKVFAPERKGVTGGWRKLRNEGLRDLYSPLNIRMIHEGGVWGTHGEKRNADRVLVGSSEGKKLLGSPQRR